MTLPERHRPTVPVISIVLLAALGWIIGLLPGLPGPSPLNPAAMGELVALTIVAGTLGGTAAAVRRDRPAAAIAAASGGVTLIALASIHVLGERAVHPELVLRGLQLLMVIGGVVSVALGLVAALGPAWLRAVALAPLVGAAYSWLGQALPPTMSPWWPWLIVVVTTGVLVLSLSRGRRGLVALLTWPVALAGVWLVQTIVIALTAIGPSLRPGYGIEEHPDVLFGEFLAYASEIFTTPGVHRPSLIGWSVGIALMIVAARLGFDRWAASRPPAAETAEEPKEHPGRRPVRHAVLLRRIEIVLIGLSLLFVAVALGNVFASYFCFAGAGYCGPPGEEHELAYRVLLVLMVLASAAALGLAVLRRSMSGVMSHLVVAFVVALSAVLFAVPAIDWQERPALEPSAPEPSAPEPSAPEPSTSEPSAPGSDRPGSIACYSGGDSDECPGG
ncbi:hypothetical protein J2S40_003299 [Nocardioides luteus]|uniref:Uncharacterized protein n=1 Tax=Nocardioides luteus TaxID=1844 RepID=A0ABQ5SWF3_9ACTN|nr:hypothetical protein [Nocardioides luteus]MDR7312241.1 hypothetical protein [Nocardioides luteus]GGR56938.1 hypothetical protein GCM10010197_24650 [Nocardioides luteus]GLJ68487.1 hypothetical protein GCM10017579_25230 [Nocardioides luteus]